MDKVISWDRGPWISMRHCATRLTASPHNSVQNEGIFLYFYTSESVLPFSSAQLVYKKSFLGLPTWLGRPYWADALPVEFERRLSGRLGCCQATSALPLPCRHDLGASRAAEVQPLNGREMFSFGGVWLNRIFSITIGPKVIKLWNVKEERTGNPLVFSDFRWD